MNIQRMFCGGSFRAKHLTDTNDVYKANNNASFRRGGSGGGVSVCGGGVGGAGDNSMNNTNSNSNNKEMFFRRTFSMYCKKPPTIEQQQQQVMRRHSTSRRFSFEAPNRLALDTSTTSSTSSAGTTHQPLRQLNQEITAPRIDSYRFSMANLEDSPDVDLDAILGELCALETQYEQEIGNARDSKRLSDLQKTRMLVQHGTSVGGRDEFINKTDSVRTDSPDNDSAFSDTVSMLSSESSASSGGSNSKPQSLQLPQLQDDASRAKAEKIRMAMEKIKEANIQKLFVKVFTIDGSAKSLLIDEKMTCGYVTRLLADKNHVQMDPKWALVENIPDLYLERIYEDHELLVENLMLWTRDSKNKIYFVERPDKTLLFSRPERFLLTASDNKRKTFDNDEHSRNILLEDFFSSNNLTIPEVEGPLYLKSDSKKGWKKYHFVLRASGLYYFQKEKLRCAKDLVCLATLDVNQVYYGIGWKKKFKAPTDYCFAIKHPRLQEPKTTKYIKYLCAEDQPTLEKWMVAMRIAKFGKQIMENYRLLVDELVQEDLDILAHARSCSVSSIAQQSHHHVIQTPSDGYGTQSTISDASSGRHSRASSSSSSGCMSDGAPSSCENAFDSEFPMGTIKRKPSMKPSIPLTNITRQLKEVGETCDEVDGSALISYTNSGTLTRRHSRRKSDDSSNSGTLKRQHSYKARGSVESINHRSGSSTPHNGGTPVRECSLVFNAPCSPCSPTPSTDMPSMTDSIISLPPPPENAGDILIDSANMNLPPPPPEIFQSTLSLDSLPPPPNPSELPSISDNDLTGSQLSLMSLPPLPNDNESGTIRRRKDGTPTNVLSPERTPTLLSPLRNSPTLSLDSNCSTPTYNCDKISDFKLNTNGLRSSLRQRQQIYENSSIAAQQPARKVCFDVTSPKKSLKKISFNLPEAPALPKKPQPPKRAESTRLTSPKKLADPPIDFLREIQRVMKKKWQVAQKCKEEPNTTPHEVLGFRDPPSVLPDYKETNVSNWVQEHYGPNNFYENVYRDFEVAEYSCSPPLHQNTPKYFDGCVAVNNKGGRRPPPPPPKRSETTHLSSKLQ